MKEIIRFIVNNWQLVLSGLLAVISVVVAIFRKKPITSITSEIYQACVKAVIAVELDGVIGSEQKRGLATMQVCKTLEALYPRINSKKYISYIHGVIEELLTTPTKKGGLGREQEKDNA